jgi:predicted Rossmann fold nucleotide-binding protein DprA/Smf involved in DNA uptake
MTHIGIVGHEAAKFTMVTERAARALIRTLLPPGSVLVSGRSPLGGIDVWAEEEAAALGLETKIFPPLTSSWSTGYKPRNLQIAHTSAIVHCLVVSTYPPGYRGMRFDFCYHCSTRDHIKSGGCWTALRCAQRRWHIIAEDGSAVTLTR